MNTYVQLDLYSSESKGISSIINELKKRDEFNDLEITFSSSYNGSFVEYKEPESKAEIKLIADLIDYLKSEDFVISSKKIEREPIEIEEDIGIDR